MNAARALVQALSNIVTANESLVDKLWESYLDLPEEEVVLMYAPYFSLYFAFADFFWLRTAACLRATTPRPS